MQQLALQCLLLSALTAACFASGFSDAATMRAAMRMRMGHGSNLQVASASDSESAHDMKVFFVNGSHVVGPKTPTTLVELDLATGRSRTVTENLMDQYDYVGASVVCGDAWYATFTQAPVYTGIAAVNLTSGDAKYLSSSDIIVHALLCNKGHGAEDLFFLGSSVDSGNTLKMALYSYDVEGENSTEIGAFPSDKDTVFLGWDSNFAFNEDGTELWATFGLKPKLTADVQNGLLFVMDVATGAVKISQKFKPALSARVPYAILPGSPSNFTAVFYAHAASGPILEHCACSLGSHDIDVARHTCVQVTEMWTAGGSLAFCGKSVLTGSMLDDTAHPQQNPILLMDIASGYLTKVADISEPGNTYTVDAITCA